MDPIEPWLDRDEIRRLADALLTAPAPAYQAAPSDATYGEEFVGYEAAQSTGPAAPPAMESVQAAAQAAEAPVAAAIEKQARHVLVAARSIADRGGILTKPAPEETTAPENVPETVPPPVPAAPPTSPPVAITPTPASAAPQTPSDPTPTPEEPPPVPEPPQLTQLAPPPEPAPSRAPRINTPFVTRLNAFGNWLRQGVNATAYFLTDRDGGILIDEVQSPKLHQVARTLAQASRTANRQAGAAAIGNLHIKISPDSSLEVVPVTTLYGPLVLGIIVPKPIKSENVEIIARALRQVMDGKPSS